MKFFFEIKNLSRRVGLDKKLIKYLNINEILEFYDKFSHENLIDVMLKVL